MKRVNITLEQKSYSNREEIRALRTNLQFCGDDKQVIMMTRSEEHTSELQSQR